MRNVGKNLLGDDAQDMASATTQRTDYNAFGKTGSELLENCIREDREPKPLVELEYKFTHGLPGQRNGFYDATVNDLVFADPAVTADKRKVSCGLWAGSKHNDLKVTHGGLHTSKAAAKRAQAAAEMAGFDPYVTTSKSEAEKGLTGTFERRSLIMPSSDGGQAAQVGRKAKGAMCETFDKTYQTIGLRKP